MFYVPDVVLVTTTMLWVRVMMPIREKEKKKEEKIFFWKDACIRKGSLKAIVIQIDFHVIVVTERRQFNVLLLID